MMMHLVSSPGSRGDLGSAASCQDFTTTSCFPWRMPKPRIPAALRTYLPSSLLGGSSLTSEVRRRAPSTNGGPSLISAIRRRLRPNRVQPFGNVGDDGDNFSRRAGVSKSVGSITDHFGRLAISEVDRRRSVSRQRRPHQETDEQSQNSVSHSFTLPGAVSDDDCGGSSSANRTQSTLAALMTVSASGERDTDDEAKCHLEQEQNEEVEQLVDQLPLPHQVDILIITHNDDDEAADIKKSSGREANDQGVDPESEIRANSDADDSLKRGASALPPPASGVPLLIAETAVFEDDAIDITHNVKVAYTDEDNEKEEIEFFDKTNEECDDDLDLDDLLDRCPKSSVIRNLQSAMEVSRCATCQMERALQRWSRISCGPFPKLPGRSLAKAELIDERTVALRTESARQLDEMNKMFFNFYCVTEELDTVEDRQSWLVESLKEKRMVADEEEDPPKPGNLPKDRQSLADLYLDHRAEGRSEDHKVKALLGPRIPPTIEEEDDE